MVIPLLKLNDTVCVNCNATISLINAYFAFHNELKVVIACADCFWEVWICII